MAQQPSQAVRKIIKDLHGEGKSADVIAMYVLAAEGWRITAKEVQDVIDGKG